MVWGESAGGHLATLLALTHTTPHLAGAVIWYGPSDLTTPRGDFTPQDPATPATPQALLLGGAPATLPELALAASPLTRVHPGAPPFLLIHGEDDTMVCRTHSQDLTGALKSVGADVALQVIQGPTTAGRDCPRTE